MSSIIKVPNIGDFKEVEIIEVLVKNGDNINKGDPVITLESDKSSVEVPSTFSGKIININVKIGDKVSEGDTILEIDQVQIKSKFLKNRKKKLSKKKIK
jgi:pyruvate/2-oxoglutarate dehydrogenase complex dihydrolipoamide acyltransferase (E2) component